MTKTRFAMPIRRQPTNDKLDTNKCHHRRQNSDGTASTKNSSDEEPQHYHGQDDDTTINTKSTHGTMESIGDDTRTIGTATVGTFGTTKSGSTYGTGSFLCFTRDTANELDDLSYGDDNTSCAAFPKRMGTVVESLCTGVYDIIRCGTIAEILGDVENVCFPINCCVGDQSVVCTRGGGGVYNQDTQDGGQSVASQSMASQSLYSQPRRSKVRWSDHHQKSTKDENNNNMIVVPAIRPEQSSEVAEKMDMLLRLLKEKEILKCGSVSSIKKDNVVNDSKKKMKKDGDEVDRLDDTAAENEMFNNATKKIESAVNAVGDFSDDAVKGLLATEAIDPTFDDNDASKVLGVDTALEPIVSTIVANKATKATKSVPALSGANDGAVSTNNAHTNKKTSKSIPTAKKDTLVEPQPQVASPKASMLAETTGKAPMFDEATPPEPVLQPWIPVPQGTPLSVSTAKTSNKVSQGRTSRSVMKKLFGSSKSHKKLSDNKENIDNWAQQPFVADFSSPLAVDSMGFPDTPVASDPFGYDCFLSPAASSSSQPFGDNFFAAGSSTVIQTETKICAWCKTGGSKTKKKLKLCSACQSTYYCSPECQSKDWINGHAKTCKPCQ